jgi:hypothetical protein
MMVLVPIVVICKEDSIPVVAVSPEHGFKNEKIGTHAKYRAERAIAST